MLDPLSMLEDERESAGGSFDAVSEASRDTVWWFIIAVVLAQVGLAAVSLGVLFAVVLGRWSLGGALTVGGTLALGLTVGIYRRHGTR